LTDWSNPHENKTCTSWGRRVGILFLEVVRLSGNTSYGTRISLGPSPLHPIPFLSGLRYFISGESKDTLTEAQEAVEKCAREILWQANVDLGD